MKKIGILLLKQLKMIIKELIIKKLGDLKKNDKKLHLDLVNNDKKSPLFYAAFNNNTKLVKLLIKNSADYKSVIYTQIREPITNKIILSNGFSILEVVCYHVNFELIEFLDFFGEKLSQNIRAERMLKNKLKIYSNSDKLYELITHPESKYEDFIKEVKK